MRNSLHDSTQCDTIISFFANNWFPFQSICVHNEKQNFICLDIIFFLHVKRLAFQIIVKLQVYNLKYVTKLVHINIYI